MNTSEKVTAYIKKQEKWSDELTVLRSVFQKTELKEEVKWGTPTYTLQGKLVAGFAGFKNHYAIWFHQGVFLRNTENKLVNAQEGVTKALRQWRFEKGDEIDEGLILNYLLEAADNQRKGKEIKPTQKKEVIPDEMKRFFEEDKELEELFNKLTRGKRVEYGAYIAEAKQDNTKIRRMEKIIPMIKEGKGLHDKYKNC